MYLILFCYILRDSSPISGQKQTSFMYVKFNLQGYE